MTRPYILGLKTCIFNKTINRFLFRPSERISFLFLIIPSRWSENGGYQSLHVRPCYQFITVSLWLRNNVFKSNVTFWTGIGTWIRKQVSHFNRSLDYISSRPRMRGEQWDYVSSRPRMRREQWDYISSRPRMRREQWDYISSRPRMRREQWDYIVTVTVKQNGKSNLLDKGIMKDVNNRHEQLMWHARWGGVIDAG